jgi:hypothetical protein
MIIPTENRATMCAFREGRSLDQFLNDMWERRAVEHPRETRAKGAWPFKKVTTNVLQLKSVANG